MKAAFSASQQGYPLKDAFILDSGSTTHICNDLSRIEDVRPSTPGDYIWAGSSKVWIRGYGAVTLTTEGSQDKQALHIVNVAWCPDFLCSLVSFRLLRRQGIWWDNREDPTSLRRWDGTIIAILSERHGQWIIEDTTLFDSAFHVRMNRTKRSPQRATAMLWHKRLGHPGPSAIEHLIQQSEGVRIKGITTVQCDACGRSKSKRQIRRALRLNDEGPGERIAIDFYEYEADSFTKEKSQMLITCRNSRYVWDFYFKDNRPARSIIRLLALFIQFMKKQFNITVKVIETDNEIITVKQEVEKCAERRSRTLRGVIKEKARAIRLDANLPWELWPEITRAAVYLYNRTPNYPNKWKSPYEIFFTRAAATNGIVTGPRRPNQAHLRAYGCKAFAMTDDTHQGKSRLQRLDPKAWIGYLVGYQSTNIYRIWIPSMAKVISTRDVVFNEETIFNGKTEDLMDNLMHNTLEEIATWVRTVELPGTQSQQPETETFYEDDTTQEESPRTQKTRYHQGRKVVEAYLTPPPTPPPVALLVQGEVNNEDMTNMSNQSTSMTSPWAAAFMAGTESGHIGQHEGKPIDKAQVKRLLSKGIKPYRNQLPPLPTAYSKLEDHPLYDMFKEAEKTHLRSHQQMKSWTEVQASPVKRAGHQILDCMWVYTYKLDKHHRLIKCKARLVVRGDQQRNITSQDTYAATLAGRSFRMLMAIAAKYDLELKQYDVTNAFVHATIDREIYMRMPKGYQKPGTLLKVQKALYGLRISPLLWQKEFTATLASIGFQQIPQEPCCMIKDGVIIFFYVDDIIVAYHSKQESEAMKAINQIQEKYACTGGDNLQWFLGVEVIRDRKQKTIQLSQAAYADKISQLASRQDIRHDTPMSGMELRPRSDLAEPSEINRYQRKIGSLLFAAVTTRPDIAFATSRLARFLVNPSTEHQDAADRVLLYLKKTESLALELGRGDGLEVASDASFADNTLDRKSSQGYAIKLFGGLIAWRASKQDTVTTSTTEAELLALSQVAKEAIFTSRLLKELQVNLSNPIITIKCDNTQTIRLVNEDVAKLQTKLRHVDIHNHWLRQEVTRKTIKVEYVPSDNMIADGFTKSLPANKWASFLDQLGLVKRKESPLKEAELEKLQEHLEGLYIIPPIQGERLETTFKGKCKAFRKALFPPPPISNPPSFANYKESNWNWPMLSITELEQVCSSKIKSSTPGPDAITQDIITAAFKFNPEILFKAYSILFNYGYHPRCWKAATGAILKKPSKPDYSIPKAYRVITLLNSLGKILERIIAKRLSSLAETTDLLHSSQIGGRNKKSAIDAAFLLVDQIQHKKQQGQITSTVFVDVKGAFDHVIHNQFLERLKKLGLPISLICWAKAFLSERTLRLSFDNKIEEFSQIIWITGPAMPAFWNASLIFGFQDRYGQILRLLRTLYGLKEDPRLWALHLQASLRKLGLHPVQGFPCLWMNDRIILFFYVDDIIILYHSDYQEDFEKLERQLIKLYSLRQMGIVKWFLGIRVERVLASRQLYLVQDAFINKVCTEFDLIRSDGRYPSTPLSSTSRLLPYDGVSDPLLTKTYQRLVAREVNKQNNQHLRRRC
ncbi:hypothetical protein PtrM4_056190 [Pyrenophora tritici-repentis]|uniref:Reverse transcriptase domain-containing protein n=2 Tax=Pyrenophora tritici-repentis TaxID=45151 RepID=A0A834VRA8_9PLEO|nr:hypothetical protein PtrM4_056190 [Pyrenophora tritici-repentis]